ncbi:MAG: oligosaccharide flippase family protein, partial [Verrucomicrobia bacterium]|nr:oligosaccharide flippase family protein [Verrucomicrobiota bacterium]
NVIGWRILAALTLYVVFATTVFLVSPGAILMGVVVIMGVGVLFQVVGDAYISLAHGHERVDLGGYVQMLCSGVGVAMMLTAIFCGFGLRGVAVAYSLRSLLYFVCGIVLSFHLKHPVCPALDFRVIGAALHKGAPIAGSRLVAVVYLGAGLLVLERLCGPELAGAFAGPMKIFEACCALGMLTAMAAFPTVSRLRKESEHDLRGVVLALVGLIAWVGLPICMLVALNAGALLGVLFGAELSGQGPLLALLMSAVPFSFMYVLVERLAYAAHDQRRVLIIRVIGTVISVAVLLATVVRLESYGAALALLSGELAMFLMFLPRWSTYAVGAPVWRTALPGVLSSGVAFSLAAFGPCRGSLGSTAVFVLALLLGVAICLVWRQHQRVRCV